MLHRRVLQWSIVTLLSAVLAVPALARPYGWEKDDRRDRDDDRAAVHVVVTQDNQDESRVFSQWYGAQVNGLNGIDQETGERVADLVQMVVEVSRTRLVLADRQNLQRDVALVERTHVSFPKPLTNNGTRSFGDRDRGSDAKDYLRPGDLVICTGYLRSTGQFVATDIRVMDHTRWGQDFSDYNPPKPGYNGQRAWGTIRTVDVRGGRLSIDLNIGRRSVTLDRNAVVLANGRTIQPAYLRPGDRVVIYYRADDISLPVAYRVVVLQMDAGFPDGDRPHCADPDYTPGHDYDHGGPVFEGRCDSVVVGVLFAKIVLRTGNTSVTIYLPKTMDVFDRRGQRVSCGNVRQGDQLRISYNDVAGTHFAQRIDVR
jgi:hypothetical protein